MTRHRGQQLSRGGGFEPQCLTEGPPYGPRVQARRKVETLFRSLDANDDLRGYRVARGALDGRYAWLEEGIVAAPTEPAAAEAVAAPAEMASRGAAAGQ